MNIFLPPLRPPGSLPEDAFIRLCVRCGKCVEICPYGSLKMAARFGRQRRAPYIDPQAAPCQLCMKCPPACPSGALDADLREMEKAAMGRAYILKNRCLNYTNNTMCMTCYDRCPLRGRGITLVDGLTPAVTEDCVGCGVCAYVCPQKAIEIVPASASYQPENAAETVRGKA